MHIKYFVLYYYLFTQFDVIMYICKNNSDVVMCITLIMKYSIENPDIGIKRYSNNGRIVDADDEYLSTSEWRNINRLFRIDKIH